MSRQRPIFNPRPSINALQVIAYSNFSVKGVYDLPQDRSWTPSAPASYETSTVPPPPSYIPDLTAVQITSDYGLDYGNTGGYGSGYGSGIGGAYGGGFGSGYDWQYAGNSYHSGISSSMASLCRNKFTYIVTTNNLRFWFYPTEVSRHKFKGYIWFRKNWHSTTLDLHQIKMIGCVEP
ncbi:hypothetical protein [Paenibacillus sp. 481]|uniref:hypothetical protein n=1 Tax=Paenibacillus sp. 481 TaxID=2835869 RepID=UPI001E4B25A6|nr:hypothetical protein [Paenibacillus sp. 481]UHA76309.1 hypothetical protein KIK04_07445 [Paenibacillus sp. 481]